MPHKIYIGNVPERARPEDYKDFFAKCGTIVNIETKNGFGFVEYEDKRSAEDAIQQFNGSDFLGQHIRVELALSELGMRRHRGSVSIDGACFTCGGLGHFARDCTSSANGRDNDSSRSTRPPPPTSYDRLPADTYPSSRDSHDHRPSSYDRYIPPPPSASIDPRYDRGYDRPPLPPPPSSDRYPRSDLDYRRDSYLPSITQPPLPRGSYDRSSYDRPPYTDRDPYGAPPPPQSSYRDLPPPTSYDRSSSGYYPPLPRNGSSSFDRDSYDRRVPPLYPPPHDRYPPYPPTRERSPPRGYDRRDVPPMGTYRRSRSPASRYDPIPPRAVSPGRSYRTERPSRRSVSPPLRRAIGPPYGARRTISPRDGGRRGGPRTPSPGRR